MDLQSRSSDTLHFAEDLPAPAVAAEPWRILIADDDEQVHRVTTLALSGVQHLGRPIDFVHAYTGAEAVRCMREHPDIALVLMDVVMETEHAGLDAALAIRNELNNDLTRIVIRTGQPGQAPEDLVIRHYGVNDYKEKTEVTARKLHTVVHSSLALYREIAALHHYKQGLEQVIGASAAIQAQRSEENFARSALQRLGALLFGADMRVDGLMAQAGAERNPLVLAGIGCHEGAAGRPLDEAAGADLRELLEDTLRGGATIFGVRHFSRTIVTDSGARVLLYVAGPQPPTRADARHVNLLCANIAVGYENLRLTRELRDSQRNLVLLLSTAIEQRLRAGGGHGPRTAAQARLLGQLYGLSDAALDELQLAATLHDVGLVAIPEDILNKPGPLSPDQHALYETHTRWGEDLLSTQSSETLKVAGIVAGQHHENWDGSGYPNGLRGEQIHLHARITALADAFEELSRPAAGARPTPAEVAAGLAKLRGTRFDPVLVDLMVRNFDRFDALARDPGQ